MMATTKSILLLVAFIISSVEAIATAEDFLTKGEARYLGWTQPGSWFKTCDNEYLSIEKGKVEPTKEVCHKIGPPSLLGYGGTPFTVRGAVKDVNESDSTVKVKDQSGEVKEFYYHVRAGAEKDSLKLKDLTRGDDIIVSGPEMGRADSITRNQNR